jgi:hypothetical protein
MAAFGTIIAYLLIIRNSNKTSLTISPEGNSQSLETYVIQGFVTFIIPSSCGANTDSHDRKKKSPMVLNPMWQQVRIKPKLDYIVDKRQ